MSLGLNQGCDMEVRDSASHHESLGRFGPFYLYSSHKNIASSLCSPLVIVLTNLFIKLNMLFTFTENLP